MTVGVRHRPRRWHRHPPYLRQAQNEAGRLADVYSATENEIFR